LPDGNNYPNSHALISSTVLGSGLRRYGSLPALRLLSANGVGKPLVVVSFDFESLYIKGV
jgi:hypothetical protein